LKNPAFLWKGGRRQWPQAGQAGMLTTMSKINGDKARFHRMRKKKLALRERKEALRKKKAEQDK
jgi:hypothetical protein